MSQGLTCVKISTVFSTKQASKIQFHLPCPLPMEACMSSPYMKLDARTCYYETGAYSKWGSLWGSKTPLLHLYIQVEHVGFDSDTATVNGRGEAKGERN